jgi:hypothetical protein
VQEPPQGRPTYARRQRGILSLYPLLIVVVRLVSLLEVNRLIVSGVVEL